MSPIWILSPLSCHQKNYLANLRRSFLRRSPNDQNLFPINKFKIATSRSKKCWSQRRKKWRKESLSRYKYAQFSSRRKFREIVFSKDRCFRRIKLQENFTLVTQDPVQPLCNQVQITDKEILEQEDKGKNDESYKWVILFLVSRAQNALARAMALYAKQNNSIELMS